MRKILILLLISSSTFAQNNVKNEEMIRSQNKINVRLTYKFDLKTNDSILTDKDIYNKEGKHIEDIRYDENGKVRFKYIIEYNNNGMISKQTGYDSGEISTILTYKYDSNNNRTENFQYAPDGTLLIHQKRIYDNNNLNTELYNKNIKFNTFFLSFKYFYDKNGLLEKTERYKPNGKRISTSVYVHNEEDKIISIYQNKKRKNNLYLTKQFNEKDQIIKMGYPNVKKYIEYIYDTYGNLIKEITVVNNEVVSKIKYYYIKFST